MKEIEESDKLNEENISSIGETNQNIKDNINVSHNKKCFLNNNN